MLVEIMKQVRTKNPLIHVITNYVTANDCANILLACGARPIMADSVEEASEITEKSNALVLNTGTLNPNVLPAMLASGKMANKIGIPTVLDPVGVGASSFRMQSVLNLLQSVHFSVIRCNASELLALFSGTCTSRGVDAEDKDTVSEWNQENFLQITKEMCRRTGSIIAMSGAIDIISGQKQSVILRNGVEMMSRVTGTGCQLSALMGAYVAANPDRLFDAVCTAGVLMAVSGEMAMELLSEQDGNMSFRSYMIDAVYRMNSEELERRANYESIG